MTRVADLSSVSLRIQGVSGIAQAVADFQPTLIVSIADPEDPKRPAIDPLAGVDTPIVRLRFHDSGERHMTARWASFDDIVAVADALNARDPDTAPRLLIHCQAGTRRSPAVAIFALAHLLAGGRDEAITYAEAQAVIASVYEAAPHAEPDTRILSIATEHLEDFGYYLVRAIDDHLDAAASRVAKTSTSAAPGSKSAALRGPKKRRAFRV